MKELEISGAREHSANIRSSLQEMMVHLRQNISKVDDPKAKALLETSAEVIKVLITAFSHYEEGQEEAWK